MARRMFLYTLLIALMPGFASIALADSPMPPAAEGWNRIQAGALLIDVRSEAEFAEGHIDGAINIPHEQVDALAEAIGPEQDRDVVLYCGSGRRAGLAAEALRERGYTGIFNATGYQALLESRP